MNNLVDQNKVLIFVKQLKIKIRIMKGTVRLEDSSAILNCGDKEFIMTYSDEYMGKELFITLLLNNTWTMGMTEISIVVFDKKSGLYDTLIIENDDDRVDENMLKLKGFIYVKNDMFICE